MKSAYRTDSSLPPFQRRRGHGYERSHSLPRRPSPHRLVWIPTAAVVTIIQHLIALPTHLDEFIRCTTTSRRGLDNSRFHMSGALELRLGRRLLLLLLLGCWRSLRGELGSAILVEDFDRWTVRLRLDHAFDLDVVDRREHGAFALWFTLAEVQALEGASKAIRAIVG